MNCKTILAARTILFSRTILRTTLCVFFITACSLAQAANVTFSGQLDAIQDDSGGAVYSGVALGTDFSGAINDVTFNGFITDGVTRTSVSCCIGAAVGLEVVNNDPLESAEDAALLNSLAGTNFVAGDPLDFIILEGDALTAGGGTILISIVLVFDASEFADNSLDNYRSGFNPDDALVIIFFIEEEDDQGDTMYEALGVIDTLTFAAGDGFLINTAISDAWFFPGTNGQGFFIIVWEASKFVFLSWFTYDTERPPAEVIANIGGPGQRWFTAQGPYDGDTATLDLFVSSGGTFDSPDPAVTAVQDGTITIVWTDCNAGILTYNIPSLGLMGQIAIKRIVLDNVPACQAAQP